MAISNTEPFWITKNGEKCYISVQEMIRLNRILKKHWKDMFRRFDEFMKRCEKETSKTKGGVY